MNFLNLLSRGAANAGEQYRAATTIRSLRSQLGHERRKYRKLWRAVSELVEYSDLLPGGPDRVAFETLAAAIQRMK